MQSTGHLDKNVVKNRILPPPPKKKDIHQMSLLWVEGWRFEIFFWSPSSPSSPPPPPKLKLLMENFDAVEIRCEPEGYSLAEYFPFYFRLSTKLNIQSEAE